MTMYGLKRSILQETELPRDWVAMRQSDAFASLLCHVFAGNELKVLLFSQRLLLSQWLFMDFTIYAECFLALQLLHCSFLFIVLFPPLAYLFVECSCLVTKG